jgi:hypothetical protein
MLMSVLVIVSLMPVVVSVLVTRMFRAGVFRVTGDGVCRGLRIVFEGIGRTQ